MSGIAGIIRFDGAPIEASQIETMTASMAHRGPDRIRHWIAASVALGHCLLRTTPESLGESQPLLSEDAGLVLVMDGRIDNREDLGARLAAAGARLRDRSDTELVLAAYVRWGTDCARYFIGDFAAVIWDARQRRAFCLRDQLGARPFYYHWDGRRLVFASELHAVLAMPWVPEELNEGMVAEHLANEMLSRDETLWRGVSRLVAAHQMTVSAQGAEITQYWAPDLAREIRYRRDKEYVAHYRDLLEDTVRRHARSQLPVACEVSGGIDSSSVFAIAEHLHRTGRLPAPGLEGFTHNFAGDPEADEIDYARAVGQHLGREVHEIEPFLAPLSWYREHARAFRVFPHYPNSTMVLNLYKAVRQGGMRGILTGYGGDEWQLGSRYYYADFLGAGDIRALVDALRRDTRHYRLSCVSYWLIRCGAFPYLPTGAQRLLQSVSHGLRGAPPDGSAWLSPRLKFELEERRQRQRAARLAVRKKRHAGALETLYAPVRANNRESFNLLAALQGVELRDPLASLPLVEFHFATPERIRLSGNQYRLTHRTATRNLVPDRVLDRTDKAVFSTTLRHHLPAFDPGGTCPLEDVAPKWVNPAIAASLIIAARTKNWPLWTIWGLFGCALLGKASILGPVREFRRVGP